MVVAAATATERKKLSAQLFPPFVPSPAKPPSLPLLLPAQLLFIFGERPVWVERVFVCVCEREWWREGEET